VYEDIQDAATAQAKLTGMFPDSLHATGVSCPAVRIYKPRSPLHAGFNVCGRYLKVLFYHKDRVAAAKSLHAEQDEVDKLKAQYRAARQQATDLAQSESDSGMP
jgi:hypothetical protein